MIVEEHEKEFGKSVAIKNLGFGDIFTSSVKQEFEEDIVRQCQVCLSFGRNLFHLGHYMKVFESLTSEFINAVNMQLDSVKICWECIAFLRRAKQFQIKVKRSNELLQLRQNFDKQLSTLTTQIINEIHAKYVDKKNIDIRTPDYNETDCLDAFNGDLIIEEQDDAVTEEKHISKVDLKTLKVSDHWIDINEELIEAPRIIREQEDTRIEEKYITNVNNGSYKVSEHCIDINGDVIVEDSRIMEEQKGDRVEEKYIIDGKKMKYSNRWAMKRALQNRRPKFKIIPIDENVYRRVAIDFKKVYTCVQIEEDRKYCESKKYRRENDVGCNQESLLIKHKTKHCNNPGEELVCDICRAAFLSKHALSRHLLYHYYTLECVLCGFICRNESQKWDHLKRHRRILQCLKCELKFCNRRDFFKHYKEWHERFTCDHCGVSFKMRYCIKDHLRKQHSPFQCKPCNKIFGRYNGLWLHNKLRHTAHVQPAYCVECDKHFVDVYRYRWHLANSARHKPKQRIRVPCPECDKVFSKNIYMKDHYNLVHLKNFKYRCEECDKNFIRNADLVKHKRRVHEGILPPKNKICYVCGKGFTTNKILTNHLRTHTGERPYQCSSCSARFAQRTALASHTRALHRKLRDLVQK